MPANPSLLFLRALHNFRLPGARLANVANYAHFSPPNPHGTTSNSRTRSAATLRPQGFPTDTEGFNIQKVGFPEPSTDALSEGEEARPLATQAGGSRVLTPHKAFAKDESWGWTLGFPRAFALPASPSPKLNNSKAEKTPTHQQVRHLANKLLHYFCTNRCPPNRGDPLRQKGSNQYGHCCCLRSFFWR